MASTTETARVLIEAQGDFMRGLQKWLVEDQEMSPLGSSLFLRGLALVAALALSYIAFAIARRIILRALTRLIKQSKFQWDDVFLENKVFGRLAHIAPAIVIYIMANAVFFDRDTLIEVTKKAAEVYMLAVGLWSVSALITALIEVLRPFERKHRFPVRTILQAARLVVFFLGGMFILSVYTEDAWKLLAGLGGLTAVSMLIFKDAILGFVSGIQLSMNRMVAKGDWIEMPQYGADGDVVDITLTTVKVQNWDKTISTIPTYALMSGSFKNWKGMSDSGGRRIKRAIHIDMNSVKFCTDEMLEKFSKIQCISEYMDRKNEEIAQHNAELDSDASVQVNGRHLTNAGTFRAYLVAYLRNHPKIHKNMTFLVRQLAPGDNGLPIEIYVFSKDQRWVQYEDIQADIFDHILAILPEFELQVYQSPSGSDFRLLGAK